MTDEYLSWKASQARPWADCVRRARLHALAEQQRVDELRSVYDGIGAQRYDAESGGRAEHGDDRMAALVIQLEGAIAKSVASMSEWVAEVEAFDECCRLLDGRYARLLMLRYGSGLSWDEVSERMGYTVKYCVDDLHMAALGSLYDVMPHRFRDPVPRALE